MTNTDDGSKILKTDALGRVRTPAARREQLLDEFERSGVSGAKFAELTGLKYQTFASWVQERRKSTVARPKPATAPATKTTMASVRMFASSVSVGVEDRALLSGTPRSPLTL